MGHHKVAVVGAGVIGAAVAHALAREGISVLLLDRSEPGMAGASFGNAGHLAAELVEPLPSLALLFGFWRELFALGGPLDIPLRHLPGFLPWARRFAAAAAHRADNTRHLAPLVKPAVAVMARWLAEVGQPELLRRNGHYEVWFGPRARSRASAQARAMAKLEIATEPAPDELLQAVARAHRSLGAQPAAGVWLNGTGHVLDPLGIVQAFVGAAVQRGAEFRRAEVLAVEPRSGGVDIRTPSGSISAGSVVLCAGAWAARLLEPLGLTVPLQAARGYHVELAAHEALADAPIVYTDSRLLVTPMKGRLRASSFMEFAVPDAPADARKPARLRAKLFELGYACPPEGPSWVGPRPVLPDYLPGIGRLEHAHVYYAIGHQHIGLTMAPVTGELIADLVAGRPPRHDISAFDLCRFGALRKSRI
jgi:glycine/D-amino acid oxidase-like deaminating enzyme